DMGNEFYYTEGNCLIERESKTLIRGCNDSVIPSGVEIIGDDAFSGCLKLSELILPEGITYIGENAFYAVTLKKLVLPSTVKTLASYAFYSSHIEEVVLNEGLEKIGNNTFFYCSGVKSIVVPSSVTNVGSGAFRNKLVYYCGTEEQWKKITYYPTSTDGVIYYYSETQPEEEGDYWRYVDGVPTRWQNTVE
ncbi:MAG: leucine-rich repeat domain-containing protein, partial [Clostridia bacterium]|nr:leucine-rich repeat domain-containing protein [Clostridia bacterium]